jgi:hypothetical protein
MRSGEDTRHRAPPCRGLRASRGIHSALDAQRARSDQAGLMFWFVLKRLAGSYLRFTWARRS